MPQETETTLLAAICACMPRLTETELKVLLRVTRQALAVGGVEVAISLKDMTRATGLSNRGVITAVHALTEKKLLVPRKQWDTRGGQQATCYALPSLDRVFKAMQGEAQHAQGRAHTLPLSLLRNATIAKSRQVPGKQEQVQAPADIYGQPWRDAPLPKSFVVQPRLWQLCVRNVYRRKPTLLVGPTGCGKTELVTCLAQVTGRQVYAVNMGATTDARAVLIGTTHLREGQTVFHESRFLAGIQDPSGLILLDEITRGGDEANNILFPLLDGQQYVSLDEAHPPRVVSTDPHVTFFATANVGHEYTGTRALDRALKDRFCLVELDYPPREAEMQMLSARTGLAATDAAALVAFAHTCRDLWRREELSTPVSTRRLLDAAELVRDGFRLREAVEYTVLPFFETTDGPHSEQAKVRQILQRF